MKRHWTYGVSIAVAFILGAVPPDEAFAGRGDKAGTSAAPELMIPVGARDLALGGSSLASTNGIEAIYWNPAGLARSNSGAEAMFSHMRYIADVSVDYFAVGATFEGFGTLGFSLKALSFGDFEITTEDVPDGTGQLFSPTYVTVGATYSRLLTDRISVGFTTKLISERIDRVSATGVAFDFGVQYSEFAGVPGLNIGVAVKNIGPSMKFDGPGLLREAEVTDVLRPASFYKIEAQSDELPSTIELGIAYTYRLNDFNQLSVSSLFQNNNLSDDEYKLGLEYAFDNTLFVRGGYNLSPDTDSDSYIFSGTVGAGVHYPFSGLDITIDYAYRAVKYLDANHVFSIKLGF
jgi:hypothetical protein